MNIYYTADTLPSGWHIISMSRKEKKKCLRLWSLQDFLQTAAVTFSCLQTNCSEFAVKFINEHGSEDPVRASYADQEDSLPEAYQEFSISAWKTSVG